MKVRVVHKESGRKATFSIYVWQMQQKRKDNPWIEESPETPKAKAGKPVDAKHMDLMEAAKQLENEGKLEAALEKLEAAQQEKDSPYLRGRISKIKKKIEELSDNQNNTSDEN